MYEATTYERKELIDGQSYTEEEIAFLDIESDKVRQGISINLLVGVAVCEYQPRLQRIRKAQK